MALYHQACFHVSFQSWLFPWKLGVGWTDTNSRRAAQLVALKQGPPNDVRVRPGGRAAGVGQWER